MKRFAALLSSIRGDALATCLLAVSCLSFWSARGAAAAEPETWLTDKRLAEQIQRPLSVSWSKVPLGKALKSLSASQHLAIVLDRRVDPNQELDLLLERERLESALKKLAEHQGLGVCFVGPVAYFGPPRVADSLRTLAARRREEIGHLPATPRRKLSQVRTSHWEDLATPGELLSALAAEGGVKLDGIKQVPHDLWAAADWPALAWSDRLTLIAAQFDLTFEIDPAGDLVHLVSIPPKVTISRSHRVGAGAAEQAKRWSGELPAAEIHASGDNLVVDARVEDHELIERALHSLAVKPAATRPAVAKAGKQVYKLTLAQAPLNQVLQQLEEKLKLQFDVDRSAIDKAGISLDELISVDVKDASLDELLKATLTPVKLTYRRTGNKVKIAPASPNKVK